MFKTILKQQQPVAYHTLKHALEQDKIAHAYMFHGPSGTPKKETAYLLAQSLLCDNDGFACESCAICERIQTNTYTDFIYLDGTTTSIKKDDILHVQRTFQKTGLESYGKKIYILDHAEHATPDAMHSILKFLEEPESDIVAMLLVEQLDRVLPTIVSRCQTIPFTPIRFTQCFEEVKQELHELDAYMLSHMIRQTSAILEASASDDYQHAMFLFKGVIDRYIDCAYDALLFLQIEGFSTKQKKYGKQAFMYLIDMLHIFFKDCIKKEQRIQDTWYIEHVQRMQKKDVASIKILRILMRTKDTLLRSVNIPLLADQMLYEMKEV